MEYFWSKLIIMLYGMVSRRTAYLLSIKTQGRLNLEIQIGNQAMSLVLFRYQIHTITNRKDIVIFTMGQTKTIFHINFINQFIQQYQSAQTMDLNCEWAQDHPQEGLFTICFNGNPLIPYCKQQHQMQRTPQTLIRKFKSQTKIKASHRLHSKLNSLRSSSRGQSAKKHPKICRKDTNFAKIPQAHMKKSASSLERAKTQATIQLNDKPQCKFHIQNIMEHFTYQITKPSNKRQKTASDINLQHRTPLKMCKTERKYEATNLSTSRQMASRYLPVQQSQVINSDVIKISHPKYKAPLISYLLKYQQRRAVVRNETRELQQKSGLYNVVTINNPYQGQGEKGRTTHK